MTPRHDIYAAIHKGLRAFMAHALVRVGRLDVHDATELAEVSEELRALLDICRGHLRHENEVIHSAIEARAQAQMDRFDVRPPNPRLAAKNFSGGNQQKIVVAREIERNPDLLLIGQPTRGVDIGAIEFIHKQIVALRDQGKAILLVSVELEEIMSLSDRIAVMFDGAIMGERLPEQTNVQDLGLLMAGVAGKAA